MEEIKLTGESKDIVSDNISKLREIFPNIFTEDRIDFEKLKVDLGENIDDSNEKYNFTWPGKTQAIKESQKQSTGTLRPCKEESKNWDKTQNLYIEGDNLEVLKLLQKSYYNKIKMIYIDPPYNTGNDFVYPDNYEDNINNYLELTNQIENGQKITTNAETAGRFHTNWLNMMYPRLKLARNLLTEDGVIFISIDDNEYVNLKKLCDEIFGEENFVGNLIWRKKRGHGRGNSYYIFQTEYILTYAKSIKNLPLFEKRLSEYKLKDYKFSDAMGKYKRETLEHHSPRGAYERKTLQYPIYIDGEEVYCTTGQWLWDKNHVERELNNYIDDSKTELKYLDIVRDNENRIRLYKKIRLTNEEGIMRGETPLSIIDESNILTNSSAFEIKELFDNNKVFDFSKPVLLIERLIELGTTHRNQIVLDFFSGSATTAHSLFKLNSENNLNRKFILIQIPEETSEKSEAYKSGYRNICEIGKERIRRAGDIIIEKSGNTDLDIGFKVFKLDYSNLEKWEPDFNNIQQSLIVDEIKKDRTNEDLVYEIMLKYGIDLTLPIEKHDNIYSIGYGALVICLDDYITKEVTDKILEIVNDSSIARVVFKDSGFASDADKTNIKEILKTNHIDEFITI